MMVFLYAEVTLIVVVVVAAVMIFRFIPVIERNAFEVPRLTFSESLTIPSNLKMRNFQIPYNTRHAIQAQYIKAGKPAKKLVVFCHETGADLGSWYRHGWFLPDDGIDVLSFNFKPVPIVESTEPLKDELYQWPCTRDLRCLERVLSWVAVNKRKHEVVLFGVSKGATVAAAAAPSPFVKAVMLDGAFSTHMTLQKYMRKWVNIYVTPRQLADNVPNWIYYLLSYTTLVYASLRKQMSFFSIERFISKLKKPVFWIHAGKDYHVRLEHVKRLMRILPGQSDLWVAEKAGHSQAVAAYPNEYHSKVVGFINKNIDSNQSK